MSPRGRLCALGLALVALAGLVGTGWAHEGGRQPGTSDGKAAIHNGTDANRQLKRPDPPDPFNIVKFPRDDLRPALRGVSLGGSAIELVQGGRLVRSIPFDAERPVRFEQVVAAIGDSWIRQVEPGVFELTAAFVQQPVTDLIVAAPGVKEIRLVARPGVFFAGSVARVRFEGVKVTSWDPIRRAPSEDYESARPFVLYQEASRLDIIRSEMAYLGSDRTEAYGVAWRVGGSTGEVTDSVFHHSFFGVYTYDAKDIVFRNNVFRDNVYYGLDPHDSSTGLVVENNEAYGNGSHGFIFSRFVTDGVVSGNHVHDNRGNGIVMDHTSDGNRITGNLVERNAKDGIVLLGSSNTIVENNMVRANKVGIRVNQPSLRNRIEGNQVEDNVVGLHLYGGAAESMIVGNKVTGAKKAGMVLDAPRSTVQGGQIRNAPLGLDLRSVTSVSETTVTEVERGVLVRPKGVADLKALEVRASGSGIEVEPGGQASVAGSRVTARVPVHGALHSSTGNILVTIRDRSPVPEPDSRWPVVAGVAIILLAIPLEVLRGRRDPKRTVQAPGGVWNTT